MDHSIRPFKGIFPNLGRRVYVDPQSTIIGDVFLGDDVSVWPGAVIRGDMHSIKVGARCNVHGAQRFRASFAGTAQCTPNARSVVADFDERK